jgi:predicted methyltransferase
MNQNIEKRKDLQEKINRAIREWLERKPTGSLSLTIHASQGGIGKVDVEESRTLQ